MAEINMLANPIPWPDGNRCAVALTWDVDADSGLAYRHRAGTSRRVGGRSFARYDPIIAVPRLLEVFRVLELKQTFFVPGWVIERYPATVEMIAKGGHEVGLHGYMHEPPSDLTPEQEADALGQAVDAYVKRLGMRPKGWRAPAFAFSDTSLDLLIEAGFDYDSSLMGDDVPSLLKSAKGDLVELPTDWTSDDWPYYMHNRDFQFTMPVQAPKRAMESFRAELDAAWTYGSLWIAVWHPFLSGRLSRIHEVVALIEHMRERGGVWLARLDDIAAHVRALTAAGKWQPAVEQLPFHQMPDVD